MPSEAQCPSLQYASVPWALFISYAVIKSLFCLTAACAQLYLLCKPKQHSHRFTVVWLALGTTRHKMCCITRHLAGKRLHLVVASELSNRTCQIPVQGVVHWRWPTLRPLNSSPDDSSKASARCARLRPAPLEARFAPTPPASNANAGM